MIIDVNNTIGNHRYKKNVKYEELIEKMDHAGVDVAVIRTHPECPDNDYLKEAVQAYPKRFLALATVNPWDENSAVELKQLLDKVEFSGLYLNPIRQGFSLNEHEILYPLFSVCNDYQVPVMIFGAAEVMCNPILFEEIAKDFPKLNIIMERMGLQYDNATAVMLAAQYKNLYLETSGAMEFNMARAISKVGNDRVLLGTGTPDTGIFEIEIEKIKMISKNDSDIYMPVLGLNAQRIFSTKKGVA